MYYERFAKQANKKLQHIQQLVQALYLDEQIDIQQFLFLQQSTPSLKTDFQSYEERTKKSLTELHQIQKAAQKLQMELQKEFGPEPTFPTELATDTHFLK
ncbi:MAG: hypothetical protein Q8934_19915 [Bacillota bacterium]|nr:hypothetical protein [Bacillota bacterium]